MSVADHGFELPIFLRRALGWRVPRKIPFDTTVRLRADKPVWMLTHPDDIRHVLIANAQNYTKTRYLTSRAGRERVGEGLLSSTGADHHRQRRLLQPLFHPEVLEPFCRTIVECTRERMQRWEPRAEFDLAGEMAELSQAIMIRALFGSLPAEECDRIAGAINDRRRYTQHLYYSHLPFRTRLPIPVVRNNRSAVLRLHEFIQRQIAQRRSNPQKREDFLSIFMSSTYPDGSAMSDQLIRDEVLTFTSTGYETLGEGLAWSWYLLAQHPDAVERMRGELGATLGSRPPRHADFETLPFTACVFREALRLYPPTWLFERVPQTDDRLPSGLEVPAGAQLYLCQYIMHRHPGIFPEPEKFHPDRFAGAPKRVFRFNYLPFGDGAHACLGENFAMLQGVMVLAGIVGQFDLDVLPGQKVTPRAGITLTPKRGIRVRATRLPPPG